ncbi:phosphohistidine phosphatase [Peptoniphilus asaccharolyticus DSM 20463]|uniref:Phosphohistidine phosphatase n=1 Tax=Peptoniphilus asaccharolyticus DSM 20463 TaxID=573058 RepID=A0A1W1VJA6_PEPAS|nr:histidine phosphatase family protein [Peptoniphilus asaccharolyticus]MBL7574400.1 histidine phosphatase family protein [Peptoniphilus asaccharolyticus]SMB93457.1 phosphohistidine phosphatase [Peptoniphilus asaccharolyticus DSM 20463]
MIYLIRHGIAEAYNTSDFARELTTEGRIKLRATFLGFLDEFKSENYKIYASPAVRTIQTAEILADTFKTDFEIVDELADSRYEDFVRSLPNEMDHIIIGHEPYISDVIYQITGRNVIVSRGSIHRLEV